MMQQQERTVLMMKAQVRPKARRRKRRRRLRNKPFKLKLWYCTTLTLILRLANLLRVTRWRGETKNWLKMLQPMKDPEVTSMPPAMTCSGRKQWSMSLRVATMAIRLLNKIQMEWPRLREHLLISMPTKLVSIRVHQEPTAEFDLTPIQVWHALINHLFKYFFTT